MHQTRQDLTTYELADGTLMEVGLTRDGSKLMVRANSRKTIVAMAVIPVSGNVVCLTSAGL